MRSFAAILVCALVAGASAQFYAQHAGVVKVNAEEHYAPIPYQFGYQADTNEGSHAHSETSDGAGRVQGQYSITLADGRQRTVSYTADETGFHPEINTNELGTESKSPADAAFYSTAISGADAAVQYGSQFEKTAIVAPTRYAAAPVITKTISAAPVVTKTVSTGTAVHYAAAPAVHYAAAPAVHYAAAPVHYAAAPAVHYAQAPVVTKTVSTGPAVHYATAPAVHYGAAPVHYAAAPAVHYGATHGVHYAAAPVVSKTISTGLNYAHVAPVAQFQVARSGPAYNIVKSKA